jgi:ankyrin repeat protein
MSQQLLKWIQSGATAEIADAVADDPALALWRDQQGVSALLWSVYCGQGMIRDYLLGQLSHAGQPLDIFEAAATGNPDAVGTALGNAPGASASGAVNSYSGDGWTPLHLAAAFGTPQAVEALLAAGALVDAVSQNPQHNQPLHAALALGRNSESIQLLVKAGADPNATQTGGYTPIFSAAAANRRDLTQLLVSLGADPHHRNDFGQSPADFARQRGHAELADWLEAQPASTPPA